MRSASVPASPRLRQMSTPTGEPVPPPPVRDGRTHAALPSTSAGTETRIDRAGDDEEKHPVPVQFLSVEAMEDLVLEAYENLQSDGENMFVPPDVSSKLQLFARLLKGTGYVCDDDELAPDTNQEEVKSNHDHTASREEPASAHSSPQSDYFSRADNELIPHDSRVQLDDQQQSSPARRDERTQIDPENDQNALPTATSSHAVGFRPAGSRLQKVVQGMLSMSVAGSTTTRPQTGLKSILRKSKVENEISVPSPRSVRFFELKTPTNRSGAIQPKAEGKQPPSPRTPPTSLWHVQRCEDIEKRRQEKARRELQVQEAARKQREEMKRMIEESQEKNRAADRERLTSLRKKVYERSPLAFKNR